MPWWPLENTIVAAGLALIVALVCRVRRVPPVVQHALWLVVLIKLITPPFFTGPIQIPGKWSSLANRRSGILPLGVKTFEQPQRFQSPATERQTSHAMNDHPAPADESSEDAPSDACDAAGCRVYHEAIGQSVDDQFQSPLERPTLPSTGMAVRDWPPEADGKELKLRDDQFAPVEAAQIPVLAGHTAQPTRPAEGRSVHHSQPISASGLLTAGFLFTTFVVICVQITRLMRLRLLLKRAGPAPGEFLSIVDELSAMLGVRAPQVRISADIKSPLICAIGRPVLMWPASQLAALGDNALRAVILHELAHLLRRDHLVGWLELVASCFWWWDPLFWYVRHQLRETAELACDAWVTALIPEGRRDYARALVDLAEFDSQRLGTIPALGVAEGSKHLFERRLVMIMGESVRYRLGIFGTLGAVLFAIAALPGCTAGHASEEPLVAVETDDGNVDVGSADDPFNPAGELSAADPAANLPLER